jgi:Tfp pilus assembly protein PilO
MQIIEKKSVPNIGILITAVALSIILLFFYIIPKYSSWQQSKAEAAQAQAQLQTLQEQSNKVSESLKNINDNQSSLSMVNLAIPDSAGIPDLYAHIEQLAKGSNLILASIQAVDENAKNSSGQIDASGFSPQAQVQSVSGGKIDPPPSPTLGVVDINMEVKGSVPNFNSLLSSLEKSLRFIDVQSVEISASNAQTTPTSPNLLSFRVILKTYYQKK